MRREEAPGGVPGATHSPPVPRILDSALLLLAALVARPRPLAAQQRCPADGVALQVLGSGGPRVNPSRASAGYLVWVGGRGRVLVDVGGGTFLRFGQAGGKLEDLSLVAVSHLHPDHVSDLPALLWLSNLARTEPLPIAGPSGSAAAPDFATFLRRLFDARDGAFPLLGGTLGGAGMGVALAPSVLDATAPDAAVVLDRPDLRVTALGVPHGDVPTVAYRVRAGDATIVFGSDQTGTNPRFAEFARGADVLVLHLTIGVGQTSPLHAAPDVVGRVARDAQARRLVLAHIGTIDVDAAVAEVRKSYTGPVTVAADLQCTSTR
jgi:ribonuclease BN (tRNA processing enzyme)